MTRELYFDKFEDYTNEAYKLLSNLDLYISWDYNKLQTLSKDGRYNAYYYVQTATSEDEQHFFTSKIIKECQNVLDKWHEIHTKLPDDILDTESGRYFCYLPKDIEEIKNLYAEKYLIKEKTIKQKLKEWLDEPDNWWKIFIFFASPIIGGIIGYCIYMWTHDC
jgi:hypothetical protein